VPELSYCCLAEGDGTTLCQNKADTYGEFTIKPDIGAIIRIAINADFNEERAVRQSLFVNVDGAGAGIG